MPCSRVPWKLLQLQLHVASRSCGGPDRGSRFTPPQMPHRMAMMTVTMKSVPTCHHHCHTASSIAWASQARVCADVRQGPDNA